MGQCKNVSSHIMPINESPRIIFTRYLYVKDEVRLTLIMSILGKRESSMFWAYELYYSGFENELFNLLWKIYFDFYYTLNPSFYDYFIKKQKEWSKIRESTIERDKIINMIVSDLLIRPHNLDVFLLRQISQNFEVDIQTTIFNDCQRFDFIHLSKFDDWFNSKNYQNIAEFVLNKCCENQLDEFLEYTVSHFQELNKNSNNNNLTKDYNVKEKVNKRKNTYPGEKRHIILSYIMMQFTCLEPVKMGKKLYVIVEESEMKQFETIYSDYDSSFYPYKILPKACLYSIDEENYLTLFKLKREAIDLKTAYFNHWEYYASFSPVWRDRIKKYNGTINHEEKKIDFSDDDCFDEFYDAYNYETDEQKKETSNKSIQNLTNQRKWSQVYEQYKKNGIFKPEPEFLEELDKIEY